MLVYVNEKEKNNFNVFLIILTFNTYLVNSPTGSYVLE